MLDEDEIQEQNSSERPVDFLIQLVISKKSVFDAHLKLVESVRD